MQHFRYHNTERKWQQGRPRFMKDFSLTLNYLRVPFPHKKLIRTTNLLERFFREFQTRADEISCFGSQAQAETLFYLIILSRLPETQWEEAEPPKLNQEPRPKREIMSLPYLEGEWAACDAPLSGCLIKDTYPDEAACLFCRMLLWIGNGVVYGVGGFGRVDDNNTL